MIGPDESDNSQLAILNKFISLDKSTGVVGHEANPRHAEMVIRQLQLECEVCYNTCGEEEVG